MADDGDEGSKAMGKDLAKGEGGQVDSCGRNQTSSGINQQEAGGGSRFGGNTSYL